MTGRRRLAIVLLLPEQLADALRTVRRALGLGEAERIAPHITIVEPTNVRDGDMDGIRRSVRDAVSRTAPFELSLGPMSSFAPETPTIHLDVGGDLAALGELRTRLRVGPFDRPWKWPYHPHVTLREQADRADIDAATAALGGPFGAWTPTSLHVMEFDSSADSTPWQPLVEEPFGQVVLVGRGGIESVLRTTTLAPPDLGALLGDDVASLAPGACVVSCELPGRVGHTVGCAWGVVHGDVARLGGIRVAEAVRGRGHGRAMLQRWLSEVAARGAATVLASEVEVDAATFLQHLGFSAAGPRSWLRM